LHGSRSCELRSSLRPRSAALRNRASCRLGNSRSATHRQTPAGRCRAGRSRVGAMPGADGPRRLPLDRAQVTRPRPLSSTFQAPESTPRCALFHNLVLIHLRQSGTAGRQDRSGSLPQAQYPVRSPGTSRTALAENSAPIRQAIAVDSRELTGLPSPLVHCDGSLIHAIPVRWDST
jgi:hypothetical protein